MVAKQLKCFYWQGVNGQGKKRRGKQLALTSQEVRITLRQQSITVRKLKSSRTSLITRLNHTARSSDITLLTKQISTMLSAGVPILPTLQLIGANQPKAEMKSLLTHISTSVESGMPLSQAMRSASPLFGSLYLDLIATGEQTGKLAQVFERIADYRQRSEQLKAKLIKALIYPAIVTLSALAVAYLMLTMVIPQFETMFTGFGAQLPWFTQQVMHLSSRTQTYAPPVALLLVSALLTLRAISQRSLPIRLAKSYMMLKLPIFGSLIAKGAIASFSRTLAISFAAGIPILTGLEAAGKTSANLHYQLALQAVHRDTSAGVPLYLALRKSTRFPNLVIQLVMVGEQSGQLDEMLYRVANIYEAEINDTVDNLGKALEPLLIVFLGVMVGALVIAMYLPIFNLVSVLG